MAATWILIGGLCAQVASAQEVLSDSVDPIRLTVEVSWEASNPGAPVEVWLEPTRGRVIDAVAPPSGDRPVTAPNPTNGPGPGGARRIGSGIAGRVRARVETHPDASLLVKAAGVATRFPIADLLNGPAKSLPRSPVAIRVERVAWDALEVHLAEGEGIVAPGAVVPLTLGFNIQAPDGGEVGVRYWVEVRPARGGAPARRIEGRPEVVATNRLNPPARVLGVPMPVEEGTYVVEIGASWEPVETLEGNRLTRLFHRRKGASSGSATRRVTLAVLGPDPSPTADPLPPLPAPDGPRVVDAIDFLRKLGARPTATGRSPAPEPGRASWDVPTAAFDGPGLRARLRGGLERAGLDEPGLHLPPADPSGLSWAALPLRVPHPGRPHRLRVVLAEGEGPSEALGVALVVPGGTGRRPRVVLDACLGGSSNPEKAATTGEVAGGGPSAESGSWPVWPDSTGPVLVLVNRGERRAIRVASVELVELPADPPPAALAGAPPGSRRGLAVRVADEAGLDRFGGGLDETRATDTLGAARNLAGYLAHVGASAVVLPSDLVGDRARRSALDGQAAEDAVGPDRLALTLRMLARSGASAWLDLRLDGPLPGLPAPDSPEALTRGLVRVDARGGGPAYQPLHPDVRVAIERLVAEAIAPRVAHPNLTGLLVRLGPGASLPGGPEDGLDDAIYGRFHREYVRPRFEPADARRFPDPSDSAAGRLADRRRFLAGNGRQAWLDWRADEVGRLYRSLAETVRASAPGATLAVAAPGLAPGPFGEAARLADRAGHSPRHAWRAVGLDLGRWPEGPGGPVLLRTADLAPEGLGRDLATTPDLDAPIAEASVRGLLIGPPPDLAASTAKARLSALPLGGDELLGHGLAVLDPTWVVLDATAVAGQEARVARFARVFRALPAPLEGPPATPRGESGVAVRPTPSGDGTTYLAMANDTPYEVLQPTILRAPAGAKVTDLGRGLILEPRPSASGSGLDLVLRLPPFGVAAVRVDADVKVEAKPPVLPDLQRLQARADGLFERLGRLSDSDGATAPPPIGFEPIAPALDALGAEAQMIAAGWSLGGDSAGDLGLDGEAPHDGRAALRLDAEAPAASAASPAFLPPGGTELTVRAWLRADRAEAPLRIWFEGEAGGQTVVRHAEVPVGLDWAERRVLVPDLPLGGLDRLRLRFEWVGPEPGTLWVDDVAVEGQGPGDNARQARRTLADALQAYRQGRYAEFARLVTSDRARQIAPDLGPALRAPATPAPGAVRTGRSTDLPDPSRLR